MTTTDETLTCVLCKCEITTNEHGWPYGHNAQPLAEGRACEGCHGKVLAARFAMATGQGLV